MAWVAARRRPVERVHVLATIAAVVVRPAQRIRDPTAPSRARRERPLDLEDHRVVPAVDAAARHENLPRARAAGSRVTEREPGQCEVAIGPDVREPVEATRPEIRLGEVERPEDFT